MSPSRVPARSYLVSAALRAGVLVARVLPARLVIGLGAAGGLVAARVSKKRGQVDANLRALGGSCAAGDLFASYGRYWGELFVLAARPHWFDRRLRRVEGAEHLRAAAAAGPVCALTGHLGNWDLCAYFVRRELPGLSVVAESLSPPALFEFFRRLRRKGGGEVVPAERGGTRLYRLWRRGRHAGLVADRVFGAGWREAPFLGGCRRFPSSGIGLARRAGAALVPVFLIRETDGYRLRVHPAIAPDEEPVTTFARALEAEVRSHPDQWCVLEPARLLPGETPLGSRPAPSIPAPALAPGGVSPAVGGGGR